MGNQKLRNTSQDEEQQKKKTAKRYEMDVETVIKAYDVQVKEMAYNLSEHQELYKKDQRQLNELKEHFEKVDEEKACISAEEAIADARRHKMETEKKQTERRRSFDSSGLAWYYTAGTVYSYEEEQKEERWRQEEKMRCPRPASASMLLLSTVCLQWTLA